MAESKRYTRKRVFAFVVFVSIIIALFTAQIEVIWIKKVFWIFLALIDFGFSETAYEIYHQVWEDYHR
ncbi:hypothetical protein AM500_01560 [Bacillus sp. FJAT-18017]|uniref:hypothetical protein n=1 Tax=Bacillus sp. FJAT-18017 TaxID=1705566 RepID=UPI0006ADE1E5|nr:hypothetical protein [Bacillus sp. FJAT-18017]ALC88626.1 hypothetical protein AM500_01560 [Bacillus sp. FJAT-18017]